MASRLERQLKASIDANDAVSRVLNGEHMPPKVYGAINKVTAELAKTGIAKSRQNTQERGGGYMFRGIDDVYAALAPLLAANGLCVLPRVVNREVTERASKHGGLLFYTVLTMEFDFVSTEDGSTHTICTIGEAMDSGDKSTNKAMSAAYKYAAFLTFCIPTEGDNDADGTTHEVKDDISESLLANHLAAIEAADDLDSLKAAYAAAYKACRQDESALKAIAAAKDARKAAVARVAA